MTHHGMEQRPGPLVCENYGDPDPALAATFALAGISLGQFYNGRPLRGLCWGIGGVAVLLLVVDNILATPVLLIFLAFCALDAGSTAREIRSRNIPVWAISRLFWIQIILVLSLGTAFCIGNILQILFTSALP